MPLTDPNRRGIRRAAIAAAVVLSLTATLAPATAAVAAPASTATMADRAPLAARATGTWDKSLDKSLRAVVDAGMYGIYAAARNGSHHWRGAAGVADVKTGRPVTAGMEHRVGSVTKAFTSVAILQQVAKGRVDLDAPIARYLPGTVPGELGKQITVRMLLNHTSGIGDYVIGAFPSLREGSTRSLDDYRYRHIAPEELVRLGLKEPRTNAPGEKHSYSNTNYVIAGLLLKKVTGQNPEAYITHNVIKKAGLRHTYFPKSPRITGPHSKMYENFYGLIDPPRDYSDYDMSWAGTAGALVSTMDDLNHFYRQLLGGKLLKPAELKEMQTTVPMPGPTGEVEGHYGLGIYAIDLPGCGRVWGHSGGVFGAGTNVLSSEDGRRQVAFGINLMKYQRFDENGRLKESPIDKALNATLANALCDTGSGPGTGTGTGAGKNKPARGFAPERTNTGPLLPSAAGPLALDAPTLAAAARR
ncbi:serine hydrolase domain-containing protein [Streptomyces sp. NPDC003077]|uniref:serine hydrolase domain-containing protein n=1 Tax=Streptomyces sp. NPDC003077 TaxID=3154443 RepID=UPI0033BF2652